MIGMTIGQWYWFTSSNLSTTPRW